MAKLDSLSFQDRAGIDGTLPDSQSFLVFSMYDYLILIAILISFFTSSHFLLSGRTLRHRISAVRNKAGRVAKSSAMRVIEHDWNTQCHQCEHGVHNAILFVL